MKAREMLKAIVFENRDKEHLYIMETWEKVALHFAGRIDELEEAVEALEEARESDWRLDVRQNPPTLKQLLWWWFRKVWLI